MSAGQDPGATGGATTHSHAYSDLPQHTHTASSSVDGELTHHYQKIVVALKETMRLMEEINGLIPAWPIE